MKKLSLIFLFIVAIVLTYEVSISNDGEWPYSTVGVGFLSPIGISPAEVPAAIFVGGVLLIGSGIAYVADKDKNYQAFVNLLKVPLTVKIIYHTKLCSKGDTFVITPNDHAIFYPEACQPKTIQVYAQGTDVLLGERTFNVGSDGARHGDWQLVQGSTVNSVVIKERTLKSAIQNVQWIENTLSDPIKVTFSYHGESKLFKSCRADFFLVAPGGNAQANPKGCLLKKIIVDGGGKHFERDFALAASGTAHGSWRVTTSGIEGPL